MRTSRLIACVGLAVMLASCGTPTTDHPRNIIAIDPDGSLRKLSNQTNRLQQTRALVRNAAPKKAAQSQKYKNDSQSHLEFIFSNNDELDRQTNILIFIQGGLNDLGNGVNRANKLSDPILADTNSPAYPIFIAWDANMFSSWTEQYTTHRGQNDQVTGYFLAPFTFIANVGRLATRLPLSAFEQAYAGVRTYRGAAYGGSTSAPSLWERPELVNAQYEALRREGFDVQFSPSGDLRALRSKAVLMMGQSAPIVLSEGVVDTGGKIGWDYMLRRTRTMFTVANTFDPGGLDLFADALGRYMRQHKGKRLIIVGHSMGCIVANELIRRHGDRLPISNIVYLAAACGVDEFERTVIPFLLRHRETTFYNLCLHPANDSSELAIPWLGGIAPRGSLLDWIDFYYSANETDYGWTLGKWDNAILGSKRFLLESSHANQEQLKSQVHIKSFGYGPELEYGPQHHGGFDHWTFWVPQFWQNIPYDAKWHHTFLEK